MLTITEGQELLFCMKGFDCSSLNTGLIFDRIERFSILCALYLVTNLLTELPSLPYVNSYGLFGTQLFFFL